MTDDPESKAMPESPPPPVLLEDRSDESRAAPPGDGGEETPQAGELEELILPSSVQAPEVLAPGTVLGADGRLRVVEHRGTRGRINRYLAEWQDEAGQSVAAELREGPADEPGLRREAEILAAVQYAMLPRRYAAFEQDGRFYLVVEQVEGETLEQALRAGLVLESAISVVLQLAQVSRRLQAAGWALVGLTPGDVFLGQPLRVTQLGGAARVGEAPAQAFHLAGYSAPELVHQAVVTGKEDVYTLGAILYRAATGQPLPESGVELSELPAAVPVPGLPQLLAGALGPAEERLDLERFYRQLLDFKQRLVKRTIALELASGTTVGLNPTRPVNEDSCGYVSWSVGDAAGASFRALLCVADGMGGMEAGELASQTALQTVLRAAVGALPATTVDGEPNKPTERAVGLDPVALVRQAASAVYAALGGKQSGTTMTCLTIQDGVLTLGHVGDTRAYLLREGVLTQLTADHSLVAAMVASGVLTKEEARGHPDSNKVLRSLGGHRELPERYVDSLAAAYDQPSLQLQPGDRLLVCSDGVWGSVDDEQLRTILREAIDCRIAVEVILERALGAGAPDNASLVVAHCVAMPGR